MMSYPDHLVPSRPFVPARPVGPAMPENLRGTRAGLFYLLRTQREWADEVGVTVRSPGSVPRSAPPLQLVPQPQQNARNGLWREAIQEDCFQFNR